MGGGGGKGRRIFFFLRDGKRRASRIASPVSVEVVALERLALLGEGGVLALVGAHERGLAVRVGVRVARVGLPGHGGRVVVVVGGSTPGPPSVHPPLAFVGRAKRVRVMVVVHAPIAKKQKYEINNYYFYTVLK